MKATLAFSLPDDHDDFRLAVNARAYYLALTDFKEALRGLIKYGYDDARIKTPRDMLDKIEEEWREATVDINWDEVS